MAGTPLWMLPKAILRARKSKKNKNNKNTKNSTTTRYVKRNSKQKPNLYKTAHTTIQKGVKNSTIKQALQRDGIKNWVNQLKASSVLKRSVFLMYVIVCFEINELETELNTLLP